MDGLIKRILVVEADPRVRQKLRQLLEHDRYDVATAINGLDGWQRMATNPADLVIADVAMPQMDGLQFARRLRSAYGQAVKTILFDSPTGPERRPVDPGTVDAFLPTPIDSGMLLSVVRRLLGAMDRQIAG